MEVLPDESAEARVSRFREKAEEAITRQETVSTAVGRHCARWTRSRPVLRPHASDAKGGHFTCRRNPVRAVRGLLRAERRRYAATTSRWMKRPRGVAYARK